MRGESIADAGERIDFQKKADRIRQTNFRRRCTKGAAKLGAKKQKEKAEEKYNLRKPAQFDDSLGLHGVANG